ncbi:protein cereblon [Lucilia cuprina]|uniref:protein cereblon n=1 Tax=Lucilia cuprina TaxID=7375 RepID=UPI001F06E6D3|nr:protein cereblon [Lucilia cuprina]
MDVDEQSEQPEANSSSGATVNEEEIATSSNGVIAKSQAKPNTKENEKATVSSINVATVQTTAPDISSINNEAITIEPVGNDVRMATQMHTQLTVPSSTAATTTSETTGADVIMATQDVVQENNHREISNNSQEEQPQSENANVSAENIDEEEHQNEQHIENAGIDPNYPLVLVRRVSMPSADGSPRAESSTENNNDEAVAMDEENGAVADGGEEIVVEGRSPAEIVAIFNSISAAGSENEDDDEVEDDEDVEDAWSEEDEDEAAFLENPNFRGFANQFEAIRNMIAHTRRSMAEAEANFGPIPRNSLMQRFRRILFILNNRRRRLIRLGLATPDVELPEAEANAEMEAANEDTSDNDDAETAESLANEESNNMTMEQEEEMNENAVRFDTNLPAEHSYMGSNMNRVSGVNYLEVDQYVKLRLFIHQHVLFPGEVLPFMVNSSTTIIEGDIDTQNGILFGVCFPCLSNNKSTANGDINVSASDDKEQLLYGVTCQIYELGDDGRSNTLIKSRALQRFVTKASDLMVPLEYITAHPRMKCYGFVKILPDIYLVDPLKCINMGSMNRFRDNVSMQNMYKRFQAATTPWPAYVYETHNISNIIEKARTQLAQHKIDTMPTDPTQLSYWLVRNLHLPEDMLKSVFLANTVNTRLKLIASTFKKETIFSCRNCAINIADCRELFAMSKHGVQSQYCNSAGYIHETNTFYQVNRQNILYSGSPSSEFSWFPGYQWHIIVCKICKHHLGWEFKAIEPNLIPKQFFGISSSSVRVRLAQERNDVPVQNAVYINFLRLMNAGMNELREARNNMPNI